MKCSRNGAMAALLLLLTPLPAVAQQFCPCLRCALLTHHSYAMNGSAMHPSLLTGACIESRYLRDGEPAPVPGTVVTYVHPTNGTIFLTRVVAYENQTVQIRDGQLYIDGEAVRRTPMDPFNETFIRDANGHFPRCPEAVPEGASCAIEQWREYIGDLSYAVLNLENGARFDDTEVFTVPPGHFFVLGDNRDNSIDSRMPSEIGGVGFVPVENLRGIVDRPATTFE